MLTAKLNDRYQFGRLGGGAGGHFWLFPHVRNLDALQYRFYTVVHFAQRFADVATIALTALAANGYAGRYKERAINGLNYLEGRNRVRRSPQPVTAVGAMLGLQQPGLGQSLQNLGQSFVRYAERVGNVLRAGTASSLVRVVGQMLHGHQRIIGLLS